MRSLYVRLPFTRLDAWAAYPFGRGHKFVDTMRDPDTLHLWIGRLYVVMSWPQKDPVNESISESKQAS